jgi:hypothetical protein
MPQTYWGRFARQHLALGHTLALWSLYLLLVMVNLMGCIWWLVAEVEGPENSWAAHVGEPPPPPPHTHTHAHVHAHASPVRAGRPGLCAPAAADRPHAPP